jgi:2-methylisocitrate lyase-like PEP mutase family enzyme
VTSTAARLRARLGSGRLLVVPGAANALAARVIEDAGFDGVYATGAGIANTYLGVPDIGLLTLSELLGHVAAIRAAVDVPVIADADTGFGNPINVRRTVAELERAGADAIQLEDQTFPKRCGHFAGKDVVPAGEMVAKVRAAVDARRDPDTVIVARTDARAVHGLDEAIRRATAYREAGADVIFVEAPRSEAELAEVAARVGGPQVVNLVQGGLTPTLPTETLQRMGFAIALHANLPLLASVRGMQEALAALRTGGLPDDAGLIGWDERQRLVRKPEFEELELRYAAALGEGGVP